MIPTRTLAATTVTLLAVLAAPAPANADPYPPRDHASVISVACASTFAAEAGYFAPDETVTVEIVASGSGVARTATDESTHTAAADGSLRYTLPTVSLVATQYELTTRGTSSPVRGPLLYSPAQECLEASSVAKPASPTELSSTGADLSWLWLSGGLVFAGLLALGAAHLVRRRSV